MTRRTHLNSLGFALPLVLMMMGVTILLMVAVFNLNVIATKVVERAYLQSQFRTLVTQVNSMLKNELSCRTAFGGPMGASPPASALVDPDKGQQFNFAPNSVTPIFIYYPQNQSNLFLTAGSHPPSVAPSPLPTTYGDLRITQLQLSPNPVQPPYGNVYETTLTIQATPVRYDSSVAQTFTGGIYLNSSEIHLAVTLDSAGYINSCTSLTFGNEENPQPLPVCTPLQFFVGDGFQMQCRTMACPASSVRNGFDPSGNPVCVPSGAATNQPTAVPSP